MKLKNCKMPDGKKVAGGGLEINRTEGKVRINGSEHLFSNIQGSELNMLSGFRVVTKEQSHSKSKKHASLKGALAGSILMGPPGTVIGGVGLGKTKTKSTGKSVSNQIPTCMHLGVLVNIDGFISEIVLISSQVDQSGWIFNEAQKKCTDVDCTVRYISTYSGSEFFSKTGRGNERKSN